MVDLPRGRCVRRISVGVPRLRGPGVGGDWRDYRSSRRRRAADQGLAATVAGRRAAGIGGPSALPGVDGGVAPSLRGGSAAPSLCAADKRWSSAFTRSRCRRGFAQNQLVYSRLRRRTRPSAAVPAKRFHGVALISGRTVSPKTVLVTATGADGAEDGWATVVSTCVAEADGVARSRRLSEKKVKPSAASGRARIKSGMAKRTFM